MSDELRTMIEDAIKDEASDIEKYEKMSEMALECDHERMSGVLLDIRHDEKTHKMLLEQMI